MIQTVKCSPLVDIKFNPGFYDALCTLNLFFCKRKFFVSLVSACHLRDVYFQSVPKSLCKKSYLWLYLTQIVHSNSKMLFLKPYNCLSKFLWCALTQNYTITNYKIFKRKVATHAKYASDACR